MTAASARRVGITWAGACFVLATLGVALPAAASPAPNTLVLSGKYHGTLKLTDLSVNCFIEEFNNSHLSDAVKLTSLTGTISGLRPKSWFFLLTEPKQGRYTTKHTNGATAARLRPTNANVVLSFSQTSGTINFNGATGSADLKVVFNNGYENTVTESLVANWSCPTVHHL
jgi:hypothetical protein